MILCGLGIQSQIYKIIYRRRLVAFCRWFNGKTNGVLQKSVLLLAMKQKIKRFRISNGSSHAQWFKCKVPKGFIVQKIFERLHGIGIDRKSTRLNSSHL